MGASRGQVMIGAMLVALILGSIGAVTVTLIFADGQAATLVGIVMLVITSVVPSFVASMQGMTNAGKIDATATELNTKLDANTAVTVETGEKVSSIHETVVPLVDRLTRD